MKKFGFIFGFMFLLVISLIGTLIYLKGDLLLKYSIETFSYLACDCQIQVAKLKWNVKDPLKFQFTNIQGQKGEKILKSEKLKLEIKPIVNFEKISFHLFVQISAENNFVDIGSDSIIPEGSDPLEMKKSFKEISWRMNDFSFYKFKVSSKNTSIVYSPSQSKKNQITISDFSAKWDGPSFIFDWDFAGVISAPSSFIANAIPIASKGEIHRGPTRIEFGDSTLSILGVPIFVDGGADIETNAIHIKAQIKNVDLASIKIDIPNSPIQKWGGKINLESHLVKPNSLAHWQPTLKMELRDFNGSLNVDGEGYSVHGPFSLSLTADGKHTFENGVQIANANWKLDLSPARVRYGEILNKLEMVKFGSEGQIELNDLFKIKDSAFHLGDLSILINGLVDNWKTGDLRFKSNSLNLNGIEKVFPFLSDYPLDGKVEISGNFNGPFAKPEKANLVLEKIILENIKGKLRWKDDSSEINGPFLINLDGALNVVGREVRTGDLNLKLDLTGMSLVSRRLSFNKPERSPLEIVLSASQGQGALRIRQGQMKGPFGNINLEGVIPVPPVYFMNLKASSTLVNLGSFRSWFPDLSESIPEGQVKGYLESAGDLKLTDPLNSRLLTKGDLKLMIPSLNLDSRTFSPRNKDAKGKDELPEPILPSSNLLQSMTLNLQALIGQLVWHQQVFQDLDFNTQMESGKVRGRVGLGRAFDGSIDIPLFEVPLFEPNPSITFNIKPNRIQISKLLAQFLPPLSPSIQGLLSGEFIGLTRLLNSPNYLADLQCSGNINLIESNWQGIPFKSNFEKKIRAVPLSDEAFRRFVIADNKLVAKSEFSIAKQQLTLKPMILMAPERHEISFEGTIDFSQVMDFKALLMMYPLKTSGTFYEANRDADGRYSIPISIGGSLSKPFVAVNGDALNEMSEKATHYNRDRSISSDSEKPKK